MPTEEISVCRLEFQLNVVNSTLYRRVSKEAASFAGIVAIKRNQK